MSKLSMSDVLHLLGGELRDGGEEVKRLRELLEDSDGRPFRKT